MFFLQIIALWLTSPAPSCCGRRRRATIGPMVDQLQPAVRTVAVIAMAPNDRVLMVRQAADQTWTFPSAALEPGETPAQAGWRGFYETTGFRLGGIGGTVTRRIKDDQDGRGLVDCVTLLAPIEQEFTPALGDGFSGYCWIAPKAAIAANGAPEPGDDSEQKIMDALDSLAARIAKTEAAL